MNKLFLLFFLFVSVAVFGQIDKIVPNRPDPPRLVNDLTNTLTSEQVQALESKLVAYDDSTSNQVAIVIIPTTGDYPIEDIALRILRDWGIGNKRTNNGLLILVAKNDRRARIEVGYGLEGAIPDMVAASIIDHEMVPNFKKQDQGNYYRGLDEATNAIFKAAAGEYKAPENYGKRKQGKGPRIGTIIFVVIVLILIFGGAAGGGGRGGGYVSRRGYRGWWLPTGGGWSGGSGGGGWSGGGWSGGGGGFGGFGGGSGGGGGASGSW